MLQVFLFTSKKLPATNNPKGHVDFHPPLAIPHNPACQICLDSLSDAKEMDNLAKIAERELDAEEEAKGAIQNSQQREPQQGGIARNGVRVNNVLATGRERQRQPPPGSPQVLPFGGRGGSDGAATVNPELSRPDDGGSSGSILSPSITQAGQDLESASLPRKSDSRESEGSVCGAGGGRSGGGGGSGDGTAGAGRGREGRARSVKTEGYRDEEQQDGEPWGVLLRSTIIRDLKGFGMEHAGPIGRSLISKVMAVSQDNYPEMVRFML